MGEIHGRTATAMMKQCSRCGERKPFCEFFKDVRYQFGITGWCKPCKRAYLKERENGLRTTPKPTIASKRCALCGIEKPGTSFDRTFHHKDGLKSRCKDCRRATEYAERMMSDGGKRNHLWTRFRLRVPDFAAMLDAQGGKCAICQRAMNKPIIDHCHATGRIRALLCFRCNTHLWSLESPEFMKAASEYLKHHRENPGTIGMYQPEGKDRRITPGRPTPN